MNREHRNTFETEVPALQESTVHLEEYGEGVWVDASLEPAKIQLGMTELELYGRDPKTGKIDDMDVPENWLGVVIQPAHPDLYEGEGFTPIVQTEDGSYAGLDIGCGEPSSEAFKLDSSVSPQHVVIVADTEVTGQFFIVDAGSTGGTTVTGQGVDRGWTEGGIKPEAHEQMLSSATTLEGVALIPEEDIAAVTPETIRGRTETETRFLQTMLEMARPEAGITLDSGDYFVSEPMKIAPPNDGEEYSFGLRRDTDGRFSPLWFQKDITEYGRVGSGEWRFAPALQTIAVYDAFEGWGTDKPHDYAETKKLHESLTAVLEYVSRTATHESAPELISARDITKLRELTGRLSKAPILDSQVALTKISGSGVDVLKTEQGFQDVDPELGRAELETMELPRGLEPDFNEKPERTYGIVHEVLGPSEVEVYEAELEGRPVAWHVATTGDHVWLDRLEFQDSTTTTAATQKDVIVAGALTLKPIEHIGYQGKWGEVGVDWLPLSEFPGYGDMKPLIESMPWAQHYRESQRQSQYKPAA